MRFIAFFLTISSWGFFSMNAQADQAAHCRNNNSCWEMQNQSRERNVTFSCYAKHGRSWSKLFEKSSRARGGFIHQFDRGYGDGLGYPEPNVSLLCEAKNNRGTIAEVEFKSIGWGDHVEITLSQSQMCAKNISSWGGDQPRMVCSNY